MNSTLWDYDCNMTRTVIEYHEQPRESVTMRMEPLRWEPSPHTLDARPTHAKITNLCKYIRGIALKKGYKGNWRLSPHYPRNKSPIYGDIA